MATLPLFSPAQLAPQLHDPNGDRPINYLTLTGNSCHRAGIVATLIMVTATNLTENTKMNEKYDTSNLPDLSHIGTRYRKELRDKKKSKAKARPDVMSSVGLFREAICLCLIRSGREALPRTKLRKLVIEYVRDADCVFNRSTFSLAVSQLVKLGKIECIQAWGTIYIRRKPQL